MWALGVVGMLLWVVNAVKAQNQTEQEGAPPNADPGGVGGYQYCGPISLRQLSYHMPQIYLKNDIGS